MSRSSHGTPSSPATREMTARASSHKWQPGRDSSVMARWRQVAAERDRQLAAANEDGTGTTQPVRAAGE